MRATVADLCKTRVVVGNRYRRKRRAHPMTLRIDDAFNVNRRVRLLNRHAQLFGQLKLAVFVVGL